MMTMMISAMRVLLVAPNAGSALSNDQS